LRITPGQCTEDGAPTAVAKSHLRAGIPNISLFFKVLTGAPSHAIKVLPAAQTGRQTHQTQRNDLMKTPFAMLATVATLGMTVLAPASQAMEQELDMLTQSVTNALRVQGFDTTNVENLTLGQIAGIKGVLESGMTATDRNKIERLLDGE
jgi:hypothetical protein